MYLLIGTYLLLSFLSRRFKHQNRASRYFTWNSGIFWLDWTWKPALERNPTCCWSLNEEIWKNLRWKWKTENWKQKFESRSTKINRWSHLHYMYGQWNPMFIFAMQTFSELWKLCPKSGFERMSTLPKSNSKTLKNLYVINHSNEVKKP